MNLKLRYSVCDKRDRLWNRLVFNNIMPLKSVPFFKSKFDNIKRFINKLYPNNVF